MAKKNASKKIFDPTALIDIVRIRWLFGTEGTKTHTHTYTRTYVQQLLREYQRERYPERQKLRWECSIKMGLPDNC